MADVNHVIKTITNESSLIEERLHELHGIISISENGDEKGELLNEYDSLITHKANIMKELRIWEGLR